MRLKTRPETSSCFSCGGELVIRQYECPDCGVSIAGSFERNRFTKLSSDAQSFLLLFIKNRGNLREVERELDISYPTVRNRLNRIIRDLGLAVDQKWSPSEIASERSAIVQELNDGKLTPDEAEELLNALNKVQSDEGEEA
ncbi:MAG: DUF2089 domain-containing protein [Candidatus Poribacteria bacterium]|nr:DUF2089 domain-containing protein [Candidatus Poribacteria bacterium]